MPAESAPRGPAESGILACPLCRRAVAELGLIHGRRFHHCRGCDLISVPCECHLSPEAQSDRYARHENTEDNVGYVARFERIVDLMRSYCPGVRTVLDYGCGPGPVLVNLLRRAGFQATGFDPFFAPVADLSERFDAVTCTEVVEHFARPRTEFERLRSLLRPDGYLVIMTEFHPGPARLADWYYARDPTHVAFYSRETMSHIPDLFCMDAVYCDDRHLAILRRRDPA